MTDMVALPQGTLLYRKKSTSMATATIVLAIPEPAKCYECKVV